MALHYLTVQDILWINLQLTRKVQHFNYAKLEEAVYYQYAYGESSSLIPQASRFLGGFAKLKPIADGNEATAFVATLTFLEINGKSLDLQGADAMAWYRLNAGKDGALEASIIELPEHYTDRPDVHGIAKAIVLRHSSALAGFDGAPRAASA